MVDGSQDSRQLNLDAVLAFLRERGAERIEHPGGTLLAHLERVRARLAGYGAASHVQTAALVHATYGTDGFVRALLPVTERQVLRRLVGADAEELVYRYGSCDRGRSWDGLTRTAQVWDRFTGEVSHLSVAQLRDLVDLTVVNELDVVEHSADVATRFGAWLRELCAGWAPAASPSVAADAASVLGFPLPEPWRQ